MTDKQNKVGLSIKNKKGNNDTMNQSDQLRFLTAAKQRITNVLSCLKNCVSSKNLGV